MAALPAKQVAALHDRIYGATMGPLNLTPPVDESITALAQRTAMIGEKILLEHGARLNGDALVIPTEQPRTQEPELFKLSELTKWWNPTWTLERAGFGGAGGGLPGIRGDTYLDGETLAIWPRDEVRGALLRRSIELGDKASLSFDVGADAGRSWRLAVFINDDKILDRLIEGGPLITGKPSVCRWERINLDLNAYERQHVVVRLYDLVLVPDHHAGNSYWRRIEMQ
jgi:hypothetical protein